MKAVKIVALVLGGLLGLALVAVGIIAATFDPNDYKPQLVQAVKERYDRTLAIDGKIGLAFFPRVGGSLERVTLSEPRSSQTFARIGEARVSVELIPLLSRKVIVDRVTLSGVEANLVKKKDGSTNFDDLLGKDKPAAKPPAKGPDGEKPAAVDVSGIEIRNAALSWRDEASGTAVRVSGVQLETGRIASGVPGKMSFSGRVQGESPKMDATVKLSSGYRLDFDKPAVHLSGLDLQVTGDVAGNAGLKANISAAELGWAGAQRIEIAKLVVDATSKEGLEAKVNAPKLVVTPERSESSQIDADVRLVQGPRKTAARLVAAPLKASAKRVEFPSVSVELDMKQPDLSMQGTLVSPITLALDASQASLAKIDGRLQLEGAALPVKTLAVALGGALQANWDKKTAQADLAARFDESNAKLKLSLADYTKPAPRFELAVDRLNIDRYAGGEKPAASAQGKAGEDTQGKPAAEKPIDLSGLKGLDAAGSVRIGSLVASRVKAENVQVTMKAADGKVELNPIAANLYQGTAAGAAVVNADNNQFSLRQQLTNVSVGPLLRDAADKDILEGRGTVALDVTTVGNTPSALKRALNGKASINLRDGAIKGVDLAAIARRVRSIRSGETTAAAKTEKTDFTELTATFNIKNGVAHNDDLSMKSPFLRVGGAGAVDIGAGALDYTVKASVVATSTGQEGKALSDLRGLTFPVKLAGPFDNLKYSVDVGALAAEAAKSEVTRRVEEKAKGRIGEALKGILGR